MATKKEGRSMALFRISVRFENYAYGFSYAPDQHKPCGRCLLLLVFGFRLGEEGFALGLHGFSAIGLPNMLIIRGQG